MKDLSDIFASQLNKTSKKKPEKKTPKKEPPPEKKQKITPPPADAEYERMLAEAMGGKNDEEDHVHGELEQQSYEAKLRQEILKEDQLKYKNEREKLKMMQEAKELIKFDMADYLFFGFMEKTNHEILRLLRKIEPVIKDLCQENQPVELISRLTRDLEAIIKDIKKQQNKTVQKWKSEN